MSLHNGLNNTEELEIPRETPEQESSECQNPANSPASPQISPPDPFYPQNAENEILQTPEYPSTAYGENTAGGLANTQEIPQAGQLPPTYPTYPSAPVSQHARPSHPPRQPIRRATMITQETEEEKSMPYRRPPREKAKSVKREETSESEPKKKKKKRRKRKSCLGRLIASIITFLLVIFVIYSAIAIYVVKKLEFQATDTRHLEENTITVQDDDVKHYLLIGTTSRQTEKGSADSIQIISVSKHNHSFTMSSLLGDCLVNIPSYGAGKLTDAYTFGGPTMLMDTITNELGIPVDQYICVGFSAFMNFANTLGGLEVHISEEEMKQINEMLKDEINTKLHEASEADILKSAGDIVLNGKQLLAYSHLKEKAQSGLSEVEHQKEVWSGLFEKAKNMKLSDASDLVKSAFPIVTTNMDTLTLYGLSLKLPYHLIRYDYQSLTLPADGTFKETKDEKGQKVFTVDYDANLQHFRTALTTPIVKTK